MSSRYFILCAFLWAAVAAADNSPGCPKPSLCKGNADSGAANTVADYAKLANDVYNDDDKALKEKLTCPELENAGFPPVPRAIKLPSGLYAQVTNLNGQFVLTFRGTEPSSLADWVSNFKQGLLGHAPQYDEALDYAFQVKLYLRKCQAGAEAVAVGHSLAGGLARRVALATGFPAVTFNPAALANYPGRAAEEASGYCIFNYVNTGEIMKNMVNPMTDAVGAMNGQQPGTLDIGENTPLNVKDWPRSPVDFKGKITQDQIDGFIELTAAMENLNKVLASWSLLSWHPIDTINSADSLIRTWHDKWPATKELLNEMARQWLPPEQYPEYAANLTELENSFLKLGNDLASVAPLAIKAGVVIADLSSIYSDFKVLDSQLQFASMVAHHGMPEMLSLIKTECDKQNGNPNNGSGSDNQLGGGNTDGTGSYPTVKGGCFGVLPITDGRPADFLDLIGKMVEDGGSGLQDGLGVASDAVGVLETLTDLAKELKLGDLDGLGKYAGPLGNVLDVLSVSGKLEEVSTRCSIALASGNEQEFVNAINDGLKFAVSFLTGKLGELGADALGGLGGTALGGPIGTIIGGFVGGWLGGELGEMAGEWVYDEFLKDWVTKNIAEKLFDSLCPEKNGGGGAVDPTKPGGVDGGTPKPGGSDDDTDLPPPTTPPTPSGTPPGPPGGTPVPKVNPDQTKPYLRDPNYKKLSK